MTVDAKELIEDIKDDFHQFLRYGNLLPLTDEIEELPKIDEIEKLLRIHFILTKEDDEGRLGVIDFMEELPQRLRRIKTTTKSRREILQGHIKGKINWKETIKQRYTHDPFDKTIFVCDSIERNYEIPENLVLKYLLQIIHDTIYFDIDDLFNEKNSWLSGWFKGSKGRLKEDLDRAFYKNVYLKKTDPKKLVLTERMINRAANSRNQLYVDAANLLQRYNKLMNFELDDREAKELLRNTFIKPDKAEVLFELYWAIRITKLFENRKYQLIEPGTKIIAQWTEDEYLYKLYHNAIGCFEFKEDDLDDLEKKLLDKENYLGREIKVLRKLQQISESSQGRLWGGRPDIVLEKWDNHDENKKKIISVFIGEVKYTNNRNYAIKGLKELLEYMALIKYKDNYFEEYDNLFNNLENVSGALFIDKINDLKVNIEPDEKIYVFMTHDNLERIKESI